MKFESQGHFGSKTIQKEAEMLLFFIWSGFFVIMALYWSLLKVIKNDIISIERC